MIIDMSKYFYISFTFNFWYRWISYISTGNIYWGWIRVKCHFGLSYSYQQIRNKDVVDQATAIKPVITIITNALYTARTNQVTHCGLVSPYDELHLSQHWTAPNHYLNHYWIIISEGLWHSTECNFTASSQVTILYNEFEHYTINHPLTLNLERPADFISLHLVWNF